MSTQGYEYQKVREKLMPQMRKCRDKELRVKVELLLYGLKLGNVRLACKRLGFGKSAFYKWWKRLVAGNFRIRVLKDKSKRPRHCPNQIGMSLEKRIGYYRRKGFGPEMIQQYLIREGEKKLSLSTIYHVICGRKPPQKIRRFKLKKHRRRYELPIPGQRVQVDVKYSPMKVGGQTVFIYVAIDECTRLRAAWAYPAVNEYWTLDFLKRIKIFFPFPIHCIQTDNGHEFTFKLLGSGAKKAHLMEIWCKENNILHRLIPPGVKELNGKVERSHRIDADYFYGDAPTSNLKVFNKALEVWIGRYNKERPHGGINFLTPLEKLKERLKTLNQITLTGKEDELRKIFINHVKLIKESEGVEKTAA